jgi:signal transduction histidine kinase
MFCVPYNDLVYLVFSSETPKLLYYSHIPISILALLLAGFLLFHNRKAIEVRILATISSVFFVWSIIDLFLWVMVSPSMMMYLWSFWFMFLPLLFALSFYFLYAFIKGKDVPFKGKLLMFVSFIPTFVVSFLGLNVDFFNVIDCAAINSTLAVAINYAFALAYFLATIVLMIHGIRTAEQKDKKKVLLVSSSLLLFLLSFMFSSFIPDYLSLVDNDYHAFSIEQYGYFGMAFFMWFLGYVVVRYRAFNVKLLATQALVASLVALIGSEFFFAQSTTNFVLIAVTFALSIFFGFFLVRSVKKEVQARELIERQKEQLEKANVRLKELDIQKSEFVSFATHQIRSPLASMKGYASLILEGDTGPVSDALRKVVETILTSTKTLSSVVEDYLNISRIELGTMKYDLRDVDFGKLVAEVVNEQKPNIDAKGLSFSVSVDASQAYPIKADLDKFKQVLMNIVDNSVKYTPKGSLSISLERDSARGVIRFKVSDTGVGIAPDVMPKLFRKFSRASNASEANIHGTGLGLYIAKEIVTAHGGRMWVESEGEGKGSRFVVEMGEVR